MREHTAFDGRLSFLISMRYSFTLISCLVAALFSVSAETVVFNWANPGSLSPAFEAPTSANRYGPYIGDAVFSSPAGVTIDIDDSQVKELSQKARFLYGYMTEEVELRVYPNSSIIISAPEGKAIKTVSFTGAKADDYYMYAEGEDGEFVGNTWTCSRDDVASVEFVVFTTINCTSTTVAIDNAAGISDISADASSATWFGIDGLRYSERPSTPGLYIKVTDGKTSKVLIK